MYLQLFVHNFVDSRLQVQEGLSDPVFWLPACCHPLHFTQRPKTESSSSGWVLAFQSQGGWATAASSRRFTPAQSFGDGREV